MRLEKPHSLSYQAQTFTSVPSATRVRPASRMALAGWWLKSEDTSGSLAYSSRPFRSLWYTSVRTWSLVYECTVFINPETMPIRSSSALTSVARQFVVHDAFEITVSDPCSDLWLTP